MSVIVLRGIDRLTAPLFMLIWSRLRFPLTCCSSTMLEDVALVDALSYVAILSTIALFLCGVEICQRIRRKGSTDGTDAAPFLLTFISCCFWTQYGVLKADRTIITINFIGVIIEAVYLFYYYMMTRHRRRLHRVLLLELVLFIAMYGYTTSESYELKDRIDNLGFRRLNRILLLELVLFIAMYGYTTSESYELKDRIDNLGFVCMLMNIASLGSPLLALGGVIRSKSSENLPFPLCVGNMAVSSQWLLYGILVDDVYIKIPNGIGVAMSIVQLSFFVIYPARKRATDKQLLL
uniref:Sugar transporter SWEET n=1 Tax=Steinernema glaseri TaxID=37863 RepID=A0A1I7Z1Q5_9BILA